MVPASIRTKNPGAMWPGAIPTKWGSKKWIYLSDGTGQGGGGHGNKIALFDTYVQGICAQLDLWRTSPHYKNKPFSQAIAVWSGGNHVEEYIAHVLKRIPGMTRSTIMNDTFWASPMGSAFLKVQASHEAGMTYPASAAEFAEAQRIVFSGKVVTPPKANKDPTIPIVVSSTVTTAAHTSGFPIGWVVAVFVGTLVAFLAYRVWKNFRDVKAYDDQIATLQTVVPDEAPPQAPAETAGDVKV